MKTGLRLNICIAVLFSFGNAVKAQVPVREEPRHHKVLENKFIRILDVWVPPGDTSLFHVHATPSVFVILSNTFTGSQIKGEVWVKSPSVAGTTWYRSFTPDTLIHRVANFDAVPFHVNDIEILSSYKGSDASGVTALSIPLLFENEKVFAYRVTNTSFNRQIIKNRGPMIAELVSGNGVAWHNDVTNRTIELKAGKYLYIDPGTSFYFTFAATENLNLVLFEIK